MSRILGCQEEVKDCLKKQKAGIQDVFCPRCSPEGFYPPVWSHPLSTHTFCRDPYTGGEIAGTDVDHGRYVDPGTREAYCRQRQRKLSSQEPISSLEEGPTITIKLPQGTNIQDVTIFLRGKKISLESSYSDLPFHRD